MDASRSRRRTVPLRASFSIAALLLGVIAPPARAVDPIVVTLPSGGSLAGIEEDGVREWRGIPYAAPPVGSLRWRPPQPAPTWSGTRDASAFGAHCIQLVWPAGTIGAEDCLYLNVFAPAGSASGLPVMVHLHGGGNGFGWGKEDAQALVERGVIVVTLNYRLGILGFVGHPALTAEGSLPEEGLLDQIAALEWVHGNIGTFGGDPGNVTLFGLSAGSFDTVALMASPLAQGLFERAAVEGISYGSLTGYRDSLADQEELGIAVAGAVGCPGPDSAACLRSVPAEDLVESAGPIDTGPLVGGSVLPRPALEMIAAEGAVPLLVGSNREEGAWWLAPSSPELPWPDLRWSDHVREALEIAGPSEGPGLAKLYPRTDYDSVTWASIAMITDAIWGCPTRRLATAAAAHGPVWRYLYTHVMENDAVAAGYRASHALEDQFIWDDYWFSGDQYVPTAAEEGLSATMAGYWTNFAKTGDPNGHGLPAWPMATTGDDQIQVLDDVVTTRGSYHATQCGVLDIAQPPYSACSSLCHYFDRSQFWHRFRE